MISLNSNLYSKHFLVINQPQLLLLHCPNLSLQQNYLEIKTKIDLILKSYLYSILNELKHIPSTPYNSNSHYWQFHMISNYKLSLNIVPLKSIHSLCDYKHIPPWLLSPKQYHSLKRNWNLRFTIYDLLTS